MMVSLPFLAAGLKGNGVRILGILEALIGGGIFLGEIIFHKKFERHYPEEHQYFLEMMAGRGRD